MPIIGIFEDVAVSTDSAVAGHHIVSHQKCGEPLIIDEHACISLERIPRDLEKHPARDEEANKSSDRSAVTKRQNERVHSVLPHRQFTILLRLSGHDHFCNETWVVRLIIITDEDKIRALMICNEGQAA